jgi:hypothetical protein
VRGMKIITKLCALTMSLVIACAPAAEGESITEDPAEASFQDPGSLNTWSDPYAGLYEDDPPIEVRINHDAAAVTDEVLPELSDEFGLDELELSDQTLVSDTAPSAVTFLLACHNSSAVFDVNLNDTVVRAEIDPGTVVARFDSGRRVFTDLDMPGFEVEAEIQFSWPQNVGGWYCNTFGTNYDIRANINVTGVVGELDVTFSEDEVEIASIDDFSLDVTSVSFDSGFLTAITNIGLSAADLFAGTGCTTMTSCLNQALDDNLSDRSTIKNALKDALNEAIAQAATIEGAVDFGVADLDYTIALESVTTNDSKDRMKTKWDVDFSSNASDASCASGLTKTRYVTPADLQTGDDLDIQIPFKKITDLFYTVAKQGDFCAPFLYRGLLGSTTVEVKPNGAFRIDVVSDARLSVTLPIEVEAANTANARAAITGELELIVDLEPACGGGFEIDPVDVNLNDLTGTMSYQLPTGVVISMSATTFINSYRANAEAAILAAISPGLTIVPSSFGFSDVSKFVSIGEVLYDSAAITIGLNILDDDPYCP